MTLEKRRRTTANDGRSGLMILEQPMYGPEPGRNTRCLVCHRLIAQGETWRRVWAADGSYSVAIHDGCRVGAR